ncbi:hypothetical protein F9L07_11930 [Pimelobacter simplex]|uniref:Uncharacterized protein n=1 Tax=Nocardioides simplex TaxID=2045 RepID=A0A7J5E2G4_NOCSI|nr:DUF3592 domain-containing protein [Pimelobacter simplex]KAB2812470.1 hypothetical protein F9L07_11930 [Pimelobacter simplex]
MASPLPHLGPYAVEPLPRQPAKPAVALLLQLAGGLLAGYGALASAEAPAPATSLVVGGILVVVGGLAWLFWDDPFPLQLNAWQGYATLTLSAGLGGIVAVARHDLDGPYLTAVGVLTGTGTVFLALGLLLPAHRRRAYARDLELMASGVPCHAVVLDDGLDPWDWEDGDGTISTVVTFRFTGADGTTYRLHRTVAIPGRAHLEDGHETVVWHDPEHPLDESRMVVALHHALRWNVPIPEPDVPVVGAPVAPGAAQPA